VSSIFDSSCPDLIRASTQCLQKADGGLDCRVIPETPETAMTISTYTGVPMLLAQTRRRFLTLASAAGAASLVRAPRVLGAEGALETTTLRFTRTPALCVAPLDVAEELLHAEGFSEIRYVDMGSATESANAIAAGGSQLRLRVCVYHSDRFRPADNGPGRRNGGLRRIVRQGRHQHRRRPKRQEGRVAISGRDAACAGVDHGGRSRSGSG